MELSTARHLAEDLMREHRLAQWSFRFDHSRRRFGVCIPERRRIQLSKHLVSLNDPAQVRDTVLHEISHALAFIKHGRNVGHNKRWREIAAGIGADPNRCYDPKIVDTPELPYLVKCELHGILGQRARRWRGLRSCSRCKPRFSPRHPVRLIPNPAYTAAK